MSEHGAHNDAGTLECGHPWAPRWSVPGQTYGWCETCEAHKRVSPCNIHAVHLPHRWDIGDREPLRFSCPGLNPERVIPPAKGDDR